MPDITSNRIKLIKDLPVADIFNSFELIPVVQQGTTKQAKILDVGLYTKTLDYATWVYANTSNLSIVNSITAPNLSSSNFSLFTSQSGNPIFFIGQSGLSGLSGINTLSGFNTVYDLNENKYYISTVGISTSPLTAITITRTGNVGIFTANPNERLTINGNISSSSIIYDSTGNSTNWNSVYSNVNSNSSNFLQSQTFVNSNSSNILQVNSTVNTTSANWNSVYSNVSSNSSTYATIDFTNSKFLPLTGGTVNSLWVWNLTANTFTQNTVQPATSITLGVSFSATIGTTLDVGGFTRLGSTLTVGNTISSNNIIYDSTGNSTNWNSVYSNVNSNSSNFLQSQTFVNSNSSNIRQVNSIVNTTSANWNSVYSNVNLNSSTYATYGYVNNGFLPLSGGIVSGATRINNNLTINGQISSNNTITAMRLIANGPGNISSNTAIGLDSLLSNTTGSINTAIGTAALRNNTTGTSLVAIGTNTLFTNTSGSDIVAIGYNALYSNNANWNTALGSNALYSNTFGIGNLAIAGSALLQNTTGSGNIAIGSNAIFNNLTGNSNTAIGNNTLFNNTGTGNIAIGHNAGTQLTTGNNNTIIGTSLSGVAGLSNTMILGAGGVERIRVDSSGNVGIGTNSPTVALDVNGTVRATSFTGNLTGTASAIADGTVSTTAKIANGVVTPAKLSTGAPTWDTNGFLTTTRTVAGANSTGEILAATDTSNIRINSKSTAGAWNSLVAADDSTIIFTKGSINTGSLVIGPHATGNAGIKIDSSGNVGIGTSSPSQKLDVSGWINTDGNSGIVFGFSGCHARRQSSDGSLVLQTNQANLVLSTNSINRLTIAQDGTINTQTNPITNTGNITSNGNELVISDGDGSNDTGRGANTASINFANGTFVNHRLESTGEVIGGLGGNLNPYGQFRAVAGGIGSFIRNDGSDTYLPLITNSGEPYGVWNGLRPIRINNTTGNIFLANSNITVDHENGNINTNGAITAGGDIITNAPAKFVGINVPVYQYLNNNSGAITNGQVYPIGNFTSLAHEGVYELLYELWYIKNTAGNINYTLSLGNGWFYWCTGEAVQHITTGAGAWSNPAKARLNAALYQTSIGFPAATAALTTGVMHQVSIRYLFNNYAYTGVGNQVYLVINQTAGSITPLAGSYAKITRIA